MSLFFLETNSTYAADLPRISSIFATLDPYHNKIRSVQNLVAAAVLRATSRNAPDCETFLENDRWDILVFGDVVGADHELCQQIMKIFETGAFDRFRDFEGFFCIVAIDKHHKKMHVVSDRRGQYSIYYHTHEGHVYLGSDLASFFSLRTFEINKQWIWEYLYYNFSVSDISFLDGVFRIPCATVATFSLDGAGETGLHRYAPDFQICMPLMKGRDALEHIYDVLADRIPAYYEGDNVACPITAGWDARTILAFKPSAALMQTYTYGVPGTPDLIRAERVARAMEVPHQKVLFDAEFVRDLPQLMLDTVYTSSGMLGVKRATLLHVYNLITANGSKNNRILSGVALDYFRGHAGHYSMTAPDIYRLFTGESSTFDAKYWSAAFTDNYQDFAGHINASNQKQVARFGDFTCSAHHLQYWMYMLGPRYFGGEMKIADKFAHWRVPAFDSKIIELAFQTEFSTLNFSQFLSGHKRGAREEMIMQAYVLKRRRPELARIPVISAHPQFVLAGKAADIGYKIYHKLHNYFFREINSVPLEDWDGWMNVACRDWLDSFFRDDAILLHDYVERSFVNSILAGDRNSLEFAKLLSVEIILRLHKNGWRKFW